MCGFSTATEIRSSRAATSLMRATVWALLSGPSPEANTVRVTGPAMRLNSLTTASSSRAERKPMAGIIRAAAQLRERGIASLGRRASPGRGQAARARGGPADDLEHPAVARRVDPRVDQRGPRVAEGRDECASEASLVGDLEGGHAERARERGQVRARVTYRSAGVALLRLLDLDQRQRAVVEHDDRDGQAEP